MSLFLTCPGCGGQLKVADNLAGKKIKCPKCAAVFPAAAPSEAAITAEPSTVEAEDITPTLLPALDDEDDEPIRPRRGARDIRRNPAEEAVSTIIPYKNGLALAAYYCGVFSLIPCAGLLLGPTALILGILGLRYVKSYPTAKGTGHAIAGIVMGGLTLLGNWGGILLFVILGASGAFR